MTDWVDRVLVDEAREWWRLWSVRFLAAAFMVDAMALTSVMGMLPQVFREMNPWVFDGVQMVLVAAALIARFFKQKKVEASVAARTEAK